MNLLPMPRHLDISQTRVTLPIDAAIVIDSPRRLTDARWIQHALRAHGLRWSVQATAPAGFALTLRPVESLPAQGYMLTLASNGITIEGDDDGLFYGLATLRQILTEYGVTPPQVTIRDWPNFTQRGVMLDISRDRVPTLPALFSLIDDLAALKINQFQLYTEHTFAFPRHETVWRLASPITPEETLLLDAYCRERHIQLVPNLNSLGHMERWLKHAPYRHLAETPDGFETAWGERRSASTLNPLNPDSLTFITNLYDAFLPHFTSALFNVGCDEPWELGQGHSKDAVAQRGGRVYLEWAQALHREVTARGRQMMLWGDIIVHYPDLVPELPRDLIVLEWGYEGNHPFESHSALFANAGVPFYVCPGTSSWNALVGRTDNMRENINQAVIHGLANGAAGILITDWGDNGHWQPLSVSMAGFAYGAAAAWNLTGCESLDLAAALDAFVYRDSDGVMGAVTLELGNVYQIVGPPHINGQLLAYGLQRKQADIADMVTRMEAWGGATADVSHETLRRALQTIETLAARISHHRMQRPDAHVISAEWQQAAALLAHGAKWLLLATDAPDYRAADLLDELDGLMMNQRETWLARSRRGGLEDSMRRFDTLRGEYQRLAQG